MYQTLLIKMSKYHSPPWDELIVTCKSLQLILLFELKLCFKVTLSAFFHVAISMEWLLILLVSKPHVSIYQIKWCVGITTNNCNFSRSSGVLPLSWVMSYSWRVWTSLDNSNKPFEQCKHFFNIFIKGNPSHTGLQSNAKSIIACIKWAQFAIWSPLRFEPQTTQMN